MNALPHITSHTATTQHHTTPSYQSHSGVPGPYEGGGGWQ